MKHFKVFGSKCYIKREDGRMGKFDSRVDKGILVGYSSTRKEYKYSFVHMRVKLSHSAIFSFDVAFASKNSEVLHIC